MNKLSLNCPHFPACSGCSLSNDLAAPPVFHEMLKFFHERGLAEFPIIAGNPKGWRCRAKLTVRGTWEDPIIGLYQKGTHTPLAIPFCQVHHPAINRAVSLLRRFIQKEKIEPYNETTHTGELRYAQFAVERSTNRVQIALVINAERGDRDKWAKLGKEDSWHSIWLNFNTRRDNVIFGPEWTLLEGEELLWETVCGVSVCFHPASFTQANLDVFELLIASLKSQVPVNSNVVEYYAGVGVIGLCLAEQSQTITCCELNPQGLPCFERAKEKLPQPIASKFSYQVGRAERMTTLLKETVIVDPPRKGLDKALLKAIKTQKETKTLFYISCGWESFQRDCDALRNSSWKLDRVEGYLLFPGTDHIELLARYIRL